MKMTLVTILSSLSLVGSAESKPKTTPPDAPGVAYGINADMTLLKKVIQRNSECGVKTKVLFLAKDVPLRPQARATFQKEAKADHDSLYYLYEIPVKETIQGNETIGENITDFPTERHFPLGEALEPGTAYSISNDMARLKRLLTRNRDLGLTTKVLFTSQLCGPCKARKPSFKREAAQDKSALYYLYEIPELEVITGNSVIGDDVEAFPTERKY